MTSFLTSTDLSIRSELTKKHSLIDAAHTKLRENTSQLGTERRRLTSLQQRADRRKALRTKVANLRQANQDRTSAALQQREGTLQPDVKVGEADAGLKIDISVLPLQNTHATSLSNTHKAAISSLPTPQVLAARLTAYKKTNNRLENNAKDLRAKSSTLEANLKRVVGLCTGIEEPRIEEMVQGLQNAVESEREDGLEVGRVREFLRVVEGMKGEGTVFSGS